jgi:hypothetical protein
MHCPQALAVISVVASSAISHDSIVSALLRATVVADDVYTHTHTAVVLRSAA